MGDEPTLAEIFEDVLRNYETAQHHVNEMYSANKKASRHDLSERVAKYRRQFYKRLYDDAFTIIQPDESEVV